MCVDVAMEGLTVRTKWAGAGGSQSPLVQPPPSASFQLRALPLELAGGVFLWVTGAATGVLKKQGSPAHTLRSLLKDSLSVSAERRLFWFLWISGIAL